MEKILVLDFGGQYNQLIARRVRENNVYSEIRPYTAPIEEIKAADYKGIILTGGPKSVYGENAVLYSRELFELGIPVMGICYGAQLMAHMLGGEVTAGASEYGKVEGRCRSALRLSAKPMFALSPQWKTRRTGSMPFNSTPRLCTLRSALK